MTLGNGVKSVDDVGRLDQDVITPQVLSVHGSVVRIAFSTVKCNDRFLAPARVDVRRSDTKLDVLLRRPSTDGCGDLEAAAFLRVLKVVLDQEAGDLPVEVQERV